MIEILHRYTKAVVYSCADAETIATAVVRAVAAGANLRSADLRDADLWCADLRGANLRSADLWGANLRSADLRGANLEGADLRGAKQRLIQIQGSRDQIVAIDDDVRIGCHRKTLAEWLGCYEELGAADRYSPAEIGEYGEHLRHIERVLAMPRDVAAGGA